MNGKGPFTAASCFLNRPWVTGILTAYGLVWLVLLLFQSFGIRWDGRFVVMGGVVLDTSGIEGMRDLSLCSVLSEGFSHWFLLGVVVLYTVVLMSLSNSFTINGSLWLRLLVGSRLTVSLGRVVLAVTFLGFLALGGFLWAYVLHWKQHLAFTPLLCAPLALVGYAAFASGMQIMALTWLNPRQVSSQVRNVVQLAALLVPIVSWLVWLKTAPTTGDIPVTGWIPFSVPYVSTERWTLPHSAACLVAGCLCYAASLAHITLPSRFRVLRA